MELDTDLSKIQSEELLRKMWQQSEDINRKKEIRSQLYKLRESRLRDLYQFDIMADNNVAGFGKDPLAPSHGESFGDQSFQSLKSKEIRDSMSPSELKFQSMALNNPSSTGWNVQSSSEVTPDGRGFRAETIATTDGVEHINGGTAEFKGRNEQRSMAMQEGDDKNFVKKASESSNTHLQEKVVIGDENSGRTEIRTSSSTSTSSSKVFQSSSTTEYENGHPVDYHQPKYLMDSAPQRMQEPQQYQQRPSQAEPRYEPREPQYYDDHQQQQYTNQQTEQYQRNRQETNTSQNVQTNETREQNKRYVDMDKASPEYQQHVQYLMSQPGEIISNTVEYPKPNVKMITTVKRLPDGTIVRNKRYETEETTPTPAPSQTNTTTRQTVTNTNNTQRRDSQPTYQQPKNYQGQPPSERLRRPSDDVVDNAETVRRHTTTNDDTVETKYSTTKTSNRKFSTETTSETIHEYDDGYQVPSGGPRPKPVTNDFSTHGFPSVRPNKPTQEFANHRPQAMHPSQASPSQKMTSPPPREALIPVRSEYEPTVTERRIPTEDGEVIVVSSEKKRSVKHHTNSERIIETDIRTTDDNRYEQISDVSTSKTNQDFSTHGFPSVREPQQGQPPSRTSPDYSTQGFPSVRGPQSQPNAHPDYRPQPSGPMQPTGSVTKTIQTPDGEVIVTSQKSHTTKYNTNSERIIETEVLGDDGRPVRRIPVDVEYVSDKYTVTTPGDQVPQKGFPSVRSPTKPVADYSTPHGFPSTRDSHQKPSTPDYSTQGFPSTRDTHKPSTPDYSTQGFPSTRDGPQPSSTPERQYVSPVKTPTSSSKPSPTVEATERIIRKEKEVDSAHRAFAASLRSSSPVDQTRRDSYSTDGPRHTPRSSVSSTKPFRRDMREGSHDSETSRISTTTVTRQTPPRSVGGKTVVVTERVTSSSSPRGTKSPSPGKNVTTTTTTTTRTVTNKAPVKDVPKSDNHNHHQHTTTTSTTNNKNKNNNQKNTTFSSPSANETLSYPINPDSSLTITKKTVGDSQATKSHQLPLLSEVIEEPCIKKSYSQLGPCNRPPKTAASEQEPSPRSSPAPSSRSSPYPSSKSKTPLGEDDQKPPKSHTSRPFMPTSSPSSRSPQTDHDRSPIGYQDVRNLRDQQHPHPDRPRPHDNDEPKPVTREDTFEQVDIDRDTTTVVAVSQRKPSRDTPTLHQPDDEVFISEEDHVYEDIDSAVTRNVKTTTKQLITHEKQPGRTPQSGVRPVGDTKRPARRNEPEKTTPLAPKSQQSPRATPSTPTQSPRKSLTTSQPSKTPSPTKPSDKAPKQPGSAKQPSGDTRKPSKPEILKQTEVIKSKTTKYTEDYRQQSPEPKKKPEPRPSGKSPQEIKKHDEPKPNSRSPGREYPLEDANEPKYTSPDYEYPSEDEEPQRKPSSKSPAREYPQSRPVGKSPQREDKPRNEYPGGRYPPGDQTNPKQQEQPGKPINKSPERRYPAEKPQSRPDDKSSKPGYQKPLQKPGKPEHPYDTEEEVERVTSEFTIKTTNKNLKTRQDIEFVIEDKPQSRPVGKSPQREYPDEKSPSGDATKPQQQKPGKPISKSPERRYPDDKPKSRPDDKNSKPGHKQPSQEPGKPGHPYDTDEERVTSEFTRTHQDIEFVDEDKPQSRPTSKSPQRKYPHEDKPRNEYPDERYPSEDKTKPMQQQPGKPSHPDDKPKSRPDDKSSKPGHKQPSQEPGKPGHPYDTDEERVTSEFTITTTNKNVKTRQDIEFVDDDKPQSRPTSKSPQRKYPHEDKPRNEYPDEKYPSEDKTKPMQQQPGKPSHPDDKPKSRPDDKSSKPGHKQPSQEPRKTGHPYDTDEERVTSEFTITTTNKNVKTRQDIEFANEDKPQSRPSSKSPQREYPVSPECPYPSGDRTKPKQQPGKPSDRSPQRTYPNEKPDDKSLTPDYPGDGSFKQPSQKPGKPQHPYDTEEEMERVTSEFTVKTTNQNVKTLEDIEFVVESKPHSRPSSKSPQRESPDHPYPSDDKTKPMTSGKPSDKSPQRTYPNDKPQSTPSGKSPKSGKPRPWEDAPLEPEHPYDVDEEERITTEMTIKTTNKNVKTRQDFDIHDENEEQLILTGKRPQKRYPYGDSDKPREESPNREYPLRDKVKPGEPSRKSPKRTHPHDELQFEQSDKSLKPDYPKKTQPGDKSPLEPEYPSDTEEEERHTSEVTVTKTSKTRKDIDILVEDETTLRTRKQTKEPKGQQPDTEEEDDEEPKFNDKKPTSRTPQSAKTKYPEQPDEPTSKTPKSTRPSLYETTAEKYIRNDDITTVTQKNVTTTIHDKFMDAERKYPTEEPQKPEDTKEPKAPRSETESTEPKKPLLNKDDKDFPSKSPEYPAEKKPTPKSTRPSLYETTAEKYIRNDDNRNVTQKTTTTTIHEQFIEAEQSPRKPKDFEPKASEPFSKAPQQPKDNDKEPKAKDSPQGKPEPEDQKPKVFEAKLADYPDRPQESYPNDKEPSSHYPEQPDVSKTVGYPGDKKPSSKLPKEAEPKDNEPIRKPTTKTTQTTTHEKFIEPQTTPAERPDGAFISKAPEEPAQYPSYIKKGTTRRDTFEDRCRQILGMETYGDTPGAYKKRPSKDVELVEEEDDRVMQKETVQKTTFEVKIEDCDDEDDEPLSINSVKKTLVTKKVPETKPQTKPRDMKPYEDDKPETTSESEPEVTYPDDEETLEVTTTETEFIDVTKKSPTETRKHPKGPKEYTTTTEEIYVTEVKKHQPDTTSDSEPETRETFKETIDVTKKRSEKTQVDVGKEPTSRSPTRPKSPTYDTRKPSSRSPQRYPEDITYQTEELTKESHIDIKKKVTSQSPTRPKSPTHETKKPSGRSPQRTPKDNSYEQVVVTTETTTRKPTSRSPMRTVSPTDEQKKPRSPSTSPQRRPQGPTYETTEVINERTETSRKPGSKSPTRPTYGEKKPSSTSPQRTPSSTSPQRTPKIYTSETEEVIIETTSRKSGSPVRPVSPFSKKPTSRSPTTSPQRTTKGSTYETVEVDKEITKKPSSRPKSPTYDTHKKPTSESPSRGPKSAALKPSKSPERPILTEDPEYESVIVTKQTDISKKTTSRSPTRVSEPTPETPKKPSSRPKSPTYETQKKPISQSPTRGPKAAPHKPSKSPERATLTEDSQYETVVVSKQTDITKKTTSRSPTRMAEPKPSTVDSRKKPTSQSPSRGPKTTPSKTSKSPDRATLTEDSEYESVVVTEQTDVTKRVTSKSPTRFTEPRPERQPSRPTDTFTRPTTKKPQVKTNVNEEFITSEKVLVTKVKKDYPETTSESEPEKPQPHEVSTKTIEITKKRNESSPTRRPEGSSPVYGSPKDRSYETIEVTNKRIESTKKPGSKSPTRPMTNREPSSRVTKKTSTPTKPIAKPTMESPKQGPKTKPRGPTKSNITEEFITTEKVYVTGIEKDYPETTSDSEMEPQETYVETIEVTNKKKVDKNIEITKKSVSKTPTKPSSEAPKKTPVKSTPSKDTKVVTETIKDRLRSSVRKDKPSPKKPDQVDAVSSPETSPNRLTERRRSSNISVNTEIIIEHTEHTAETATTKKTKDSVYKEIIDSTTLPEKLTRKMPVTERKESAPVHRVTRKDKDTKMSRSTSENLIKVQKKPEEDKPRILTPTADKKPTPKPSADHRRPNKCFATKTINLSATDRLMSSEDMENVIIDIQHAKSSREPSPDKIVPTPVPAHLDTGKPRYPDVVQEPEDEPKRKPVIKNIPIFEEENNSYVGCHISEASHRTFEDDDDSLCTPLVEAPSSLDYPSISETSYPTTTVVTDDECLLSVHDKVSRFQNIAEEVKKPKTSSPFHREFDDKTRVPDNDECLLSVDEKVDKFIKSAESLTTKQTTITTARDSKPKEFPGFNDDEDDLEVTECPFTTVKLAPSEPQKSPELVRHISRHISRQSDMGEPATEQQHTHRNETTMHEEFLSSQTTAEEFVTHRRDQTTSAVKQQPRRPVDRHDDDEVYDEVHVNGDDDDEELIPHTAMHTVRLEERRQKDILARPSVFDNSKPRGGSTKPTPTPTKPTTATTPSTASRINKTQPRYVSPATKDSEKSRQSTPQQQRPQVKPKQSPKVTATATTTITSHTTTTTSAANKRQPHTQSPQQRRTHPDSDSDYRVGSHNKNETPVKSSTTIGKQKPKQQPVYGSINGPKKSPHSPQPVVGISVTVKKSPMHTAEQQRRSTTTSKNVKRSHVEVDEYEHDDDSDNVDYVEEFQVVEEVVPNDDSETELIINSDTTVRSTNSHQTKEETVKTKQATANNVRREPSTASPTSKSPATRPKMKETTPGSPLSTPSRSTKDHHSVDLTEKSTLHKHSTTNKSPSTTTTTTTEPNESFLENRPPIKKTPGQTPYRPKTMITPTESVAARRSLFENHNNQATKPLARRPTPTSTSSSPSSGRRPSYMDHTKSSLEHIRRDSLEINKTNYTRRPSANDDDAPDRNGQVKFDVPQKPRSDVLDTDDSEYNIEEIFDLVILEKLLETVTSYEVRRRIRAQIRLVKKNMSNAEYTTVTTTSTRDNKTKPTSAQVISRKEEKQQQQQHYYYKEEHQREERHSSTHTSPERVRTTQVTKVTTRRTESPDSKYSSPSEGRSVSPQSRLSQTRVCSRTHERSPSPSSVATEIKVKEVKKKQYENVEHVEEIYRESSPKIRKPKAYYPIDDDEEEVDTLSRPVKKTDVSEEYDSAELHEERTFKKETTHRRSSRKSISPQSSPERQKASSPLAGSPEGKKPLTSRVSPKSPERKTIITEQQQQQTLMTTKHQPKRTPVSAPLKSKPEPKAPVWADRKNILKSPSVTPKKPSAVAPDSRISSSVSRTMKSSTQQQKVSSSTKSSYVEDDCITSSYGIGPTDENGLPLFGIRALKMKKPQQQQQPASEPTCETTEEVTGYVVEEKYYSDNKSKPIVERKEIIYSTNPEELQAIKEKVRETATTTTTLKSVKHDKLESDDESPFRDNSTYKTKTITSVRSSPEEFLESSTTKYVRRGSVKEMSEKFLQKESASMVSEKTNNYPKAGLILRTNSRKQSRDNDDMDGENNEYYESRTSYRDTDEENECRLVAGGEREYIVESESETESIKKTQREFKKITSTKSSSSSRSFLNTKGEEKIITGVDDVLDRMRNADNVVEEGDTAEDQEARALLNKFLGASIIMKGVESTIPTIPTVNRETKIITTTTTGVGSGRQPAKHEVKTTRVTKSIKSGSSSSPVIETTCDIEEIWDEEILKQLLEQAKTYEERRKIRSRLRELMADRAEKNSCQQTGKEEGESAAVAVVAAGKRVEELKSPVQRSESSASSEYEIIEEEVTCTESESEEVKETAETTAPQKEEELKQSSQEEEKEDTTSAPPDVVPTEPPSTEEQSQKQEEQQEKEEEKKVEETKESDTTDSAKETTDSCAEKGESPAMPTQQGSMHQQQNKMMQVHQANNQKLASQHSSSPAASSKLSSDRSQMHAPSNNKQSSSAYLANGQYAKNPTVTVTAGNTTVRDLGSSSSLGALGSSNNNNSGSSSSISSSQRQVDRLGVPQKEDSGTESGEDLRFIAAGLRDQLQMKSDSNIIDDVTCALSRLEASLKEGKDISVDTEKRKALLALVGRLQAGLTSPEKLAEIAAAMSELDGNDPIYGETSSPEADAHRSNRQRFAKRRNRIDRHTVGVSREELADARRYMEDMLIMENICQATTPEAANSNSPPQWFPLEKNASTGSILMHNNSGSSLAMRQNNFLNENYVQNAATNNSLLPNAQSTGKRRPVSGDFSVSFGLPSTTYQDNSNTAQMQTSYVEERNAENASSDSNSKFARFTNKKQLMKRANTIDIAKTKRFNSDLDTDSDAEDRSQTIGLKRTVHPTVKKRVSNVVPPFEPKTENDRKFLAFINKQSDKPGLGWTNSRSVSNWTTKFGSLKHTFEAGGSGTVTAAKPPQIPSHIHPRPAVQQQQHHVPKQPQAPVQNYMSTNQQIAQRLQQEAQRQAEERRIKLEYERMEAERREREKLELLRQQQQRERMERERLEREYYEREIRERNQRAAQQSASVNVPKPIPINEFKHAPQSVFRPIDNGDSQQRGIYKPIPQLPAGPHSWQAPLSAAPNSRSHEPLSPSSYAPHTRPDNSFITTPPPSSKSPIGLPWASKPTVDSSSFKSKANKFEERSKYDNYNNGAMLQRHHSLRSSNMNVMPNDDFKKRPSLPNTSDPFGVQRNFHSDYPANPPLSYATTNPPLSYGGSAVPEPPPPTNISFVYNNHTSKPTYLSYPCLPTAVMESGNYGRSREDSLTNPQAVPLVLTSANPSYCPPQQSQPAAREYMSSSTLDVMSPPDSTLTSPSIPAMQQQPLTDYTDDDLESENLTEYRAVSKVMAKPQSQTAVTVGRRTGHVSDDEVYGKNSKAAKSLLSTMKSIGSKTNGESKQRPPVLQTTKRPEPVTSPQTCLSPDGRAYQAPMVDPIFPDLTNFEPNRKPLYEGSTKKPQATPTPYGQPRKQPTMYKSLENIAKRVPPPQQSPVANPNHAPTYVPRQCPSPTPYVSETQTSYVVTYPIDDTTDDEDQSRYSSYSRSSDAVPMRRSRNTSETSTLSSTTTAPMVYSNHVPSPNTSWTTNPINEPTIVATSGQSFYEPAQVQGYATSQSNAPTTLSKASPSYQTPKMSTQYQPSSPAAYTNSMPAPYPATTTTTQYQSTSQVSQPSPTKTNYTSPPQYPTSYPSSQQTNHYEVSQPQIQQQLPTQVPTNQTKTPVMQTNQTVVAPQKTSSATPAKSKKTVTSSASKQTQEKVSIKTSLANMRKSVSEDYQDVKSVTTATRKSSISKDTASNKVEQKKIESQTATTDVRRKSLGSTVEYQKTEERHTTAMATKQTVQPEQQIYKSSAPPDTPDIVKSSLPKDENQPILKKFGPPQRHHYTPNSYQSPLGKGDTTTATTASKTEHHTKSVKVTATKSILKTSATTKAPTVIEKPASPEPEEEYIPRNIVYNNIHAFTAMSARRPDENRSHFEPVIRPNKLSKSDSWNQIVNLQNQASAQKFVPSPTNELRRTKSGHTLSIPKMYEAGLDKTEVTEKQRTVAAYFSGQKSPVHHEQTVVEQTKKSTINRTKTSEKISASRKSMGSHHTVSQGGGLTRSATMPHIANLRLLDESNVEDAFEQLMMDAKPQQSCTSTTEKTETKGKDGAVVTTTTKVTTRTVSGTGPKPVSPFAKFKQLDRQNSQQSTKSPTTPTTPGGGPAASPSATGNAPIFRFTDPSLNARAATAKEQLLQWCQLKTKEYENVQITNFSSSWVDGLAFCALIHHFLPDAFDYSKLTPQNRRENFELAFTVADEKAGIAPLLDVEDMVVMKRPDWKCVFVYVQSIYRRFRNCQ